jgi:hypothetical protein
MKFNVPAIFVYATTAATALLSVADLLPKSWLPYIIVAGALAHAFTPRAVKNSSASIPPQTGGGQSGRVSIKMLLAMLALCLSLPLIFAACPKSNPKSNANSNASQSAADKLQQRASKAAELADHGASDIAAIRATVRVLQRDGVINDEQAHDLEQGTLDANSALSEAVNSALSYGSLDEFARAGMAEHIQKFRTALQNLQAKGALHIKNQTRRAIFDGILVAAGIALDRFESDNAAPIPDGVTYTLDAAIRARLEHAAQSLAANDKQLRADLAPAPSQ